MSLNRPPSHEEKVRIFLQCALRSYEFNKDVPEYLIDTYLINDHWIEFPARSLSDILEEYERRVNEA